MSGTVLTYALFAGAALIAMWLVVRFPNVGAGLTPAFLHASAGMLLVLVPLPFAMRAALQGGTRFDLLAASIGVALPALTYMFLGAAWVLRALQQLLPARR